jgi:hypothetical protein
MIQITNQYEQNVLLPKQLVNENDNQYALFIEFLNRGFIRTFSKFATSLQLNPRTIQAYARKYKWIERAKEHDHKYKQRNKNEQSLIKSETDIEKLKLLNQAQKRANSIMHQITFITEDGNTLFDDKTRLNPADFEGDFDRKVLRNMRILRMIEMYIRICADIDKRFEAIIQNNDEYNQLDESVLELEEYYKEELDRLESYLQTDPDESLWDELEKIENPTQEKLAAL